MGKSDEKIDTHVRLDGELAEAVKLRAKRGSRSIPAEIARALRVAYKMTAPAEHA